MSRIRLEAQLVDQYPTPETRWSSYEQNNMDMPLWAVARPSNGEYNSCCVSDLQGGLEPTSCHNNSFYLYTFDIY